MSRLILAASIILFGCATTPVIADGPSAGECGAGPVTITVRMMGHCPGPLAYGLQRTADGVYVEASATVSMVCWVEEQRELPDWPECLQAEGSE